jgi:hypothetical protein
MSDLTSIARWLILIGIALTGLGGLLWIFSRLGLPLGRLPGDFHFETGDFSCFIPLASSILISVLLTLILNVIARLLNK